MNEDRDRDARAGQPAGWSLPRVVVALLVTAGIGVLAGTRMAGTPAGTAPRGAPADHASQQLWTCSMHPQVIQDHPGACPICGMQLVPLRGVADAAETGAPSVRIDPVMVQNMGLRVARVTEGPLRRTLRLVGVLREPEGSRHDVNLRVSGWIETLQGHTAGMGIGAGDPLFELYSPELQVAIEELIAARRMRAAGAESDGPAALVADAAGSKLVQWGLQPEEVERLAQLEHAPRTVTFRSPVSGHVTEKFVNAGSAVKAGDLVLRLSDRSSMWVELQVHEQDLSLVRVGQAVTVRIESLPGVALEGTIGFIHPHLDAMTRTAMARVVLASHGHELRQEMYATAEAVVEVAPSAVLVPREAVIDTGTRQIAFVPREPGRFEPRAVVMGESGDDGLVQVLSGLAAGETVVTSGQFLLDSESRLREAIAKQLREGLLEPPAAGAH